MTTLQNKTDELLL